MPMRSGSRVAIVGVKASYSYSILLATVGAFGEQCFWQLVHAMLFVGAMPSVHDTIETIECGARW